MIEPRKGLLDGVYARCVRIRRPVQHDHLDAERARGGDLAIGRGAAAVLRYDNFDLVFCHQRAITCFAERAARGDVGDMRKWQRRVNRIDAADQITVLWGACKRREFVAADGDEHIAAFQADGISRRTRIPDLDPPVPRHCAPGRATQRYKRHGHLACRRGGVLRDDIRVGVRGVDQRVDTLCGEMIRQALGAAKTANTDRHGMRNRRGRTSGERQRHLKAGALREPFRQLPRFRRAAEDEDFRHAAS